MIQKSYRANKPGPPSRRRLGLKSDLKFGTWNVRTLYSGGALRKLTDVFGEYRIDVLAIQEIRWIGQGILDKKDCSIYYSCHDRLHQFGTGFVVSKRMRERVIDFKPINERICKLRVKCLKQNISLICAHAPTEEKCDDEKEAFYDMLESAINECPVSDVKLVLGDFNARIGNKQNLKTFAGNHSLHSDFSNNGERLLDLAESTDMLIGSTAFRHQDIHKYTWRSPDGKTFNQIDHVLIDLRHRSSLLDVRSYRGANVDSDHFLVLSKVRNKLSKIFYKKREQKSKVLDVEKLKSSDVFKRYKVVVRRTLLDSEPISRGEHDWNNLKDIIISAAEETIPVRQKNRQKEWFDTDCSNITERKNKAYKQMIQRYTRNTEEQYKELRKQEKRTHRKKKKEHLEEKYRELEDMKSQRDARKFYQLVNEVRRDFNSRSISCRKSNGEVTRNIDEVTSRYREHFKDLLCGKDAETESSDNVDMLIPLKNYNEDHLPSLNDVTLVVKNLNNNKAAWPDGIRAEFLKIDELKFIDELHKVIYAMSGNIKKLPTE